MIRAAVLALLSCTAAVAACGGEVSVALDAATDATADAEVDAPSPCGTDVAVDGVYVDWDSTTASYAGIGGAAWTVVSPAGGPTVTAEPDGRVHLCISRTSTTQIDVTHPGYMPARFVADGPAFNAPGVTFAVRGLRTGAGPTSFGVLGENFNTAAAQLEVYKVGAPIPLALQPATNPPQRSYVSDGPDDTTWAAGAAGTLTLFINRPIVGDSVTLTSTSSFVGPAALPIAAGRFTIAVIR